MCSCGNYRCSSTESARSKNCQKAVVIHSLLYSYNNSVHIYTDASKTTNNKTSAAFCIPELNIELSIRLSDNVTIFAAELSAIKLALLGYQQLRPKY